MGTISDRWVVYPLENLSPNETYLQGRSSKMGFPPVIKTDNSQGELLKMDGSLPTALF